MKQCIIVIIDPATQKLSSSPILKNRCIRSYSYHVISPSVKIKTVNVVCVPITFLGKDTVLSSGKSGRQLVEERLAGRFGRAARPEDIAAAAAFLASDEAWYVNGACLVIDAAAEVAGTKARRYFGLPDA